MNALNDMMLLSGAETPESAEEYYSALQRQINSGQVWLMEGTMGRGAMAAIEAGDCMLGEVARKDYWGSWVPSRKDVRAGTKGSSQYVAEHRSEKWAKMLKKVE